MDQVPLIKRILQTLDEFTGKVKVIYARCEDIQFRAQRLENWFKNQTNPRARPPDRPFPDDLKVLRREIKHIIQEFDYVPLWLAKAERATVAQPDALDLATRLSRSASAFQQVVMGLLAPLQVTYNHLKVAEWKIDAWFLAQEVEAWGKEVVQVPLRCHTILLKINPLDDTPPPPGAESGDKKPPEAAP